MIIGWRDSVYNKIFENLIEAQYKNIVLIDIFKQNIINFKNEKKNIKYFVADVRNSLNIFSKNSFDLICWQHGPEHLEKQESVNIIENQLKIISKNYILLESPLGEFNQDEMYGNIYEKHLSSWSEEDYQNMKFKTAMGEENKNIIALWKKN